MRKIIFLSLFLLLPIFSWGWDGRVHSPVNEEMVIYKDRQFKPNHQAIDINVPIGTNVYAAEDGFVIFSGEGNRGGGSIVILDHGRNWYTSYMHLSEIYVSKGDYVRPKELIALSGMTGTKWAHLHFSIEYNGKMKDPCYWLRCNILDIFRKDEIK